MIFTKKYKPETIEPLRFEGQEIAFTNTVKYLGVSLDPKLNWKQHLIDKRKKFYASVWVFRRAIGKTWGIKYKIALWMYKAILLPKLLYAAIVWWPMVSRVEIRNLLRSLQGSYLRAVVGAMKTTPTEALEVVLYQAALDLVAIETAGLTAYRLECQAEWRNAGLGRTKLEFLKKYLYTLKQDRILKKYQLVKPYEIRVKTRQDWQNAEKVSYHSVDLCFTNRSGIHDGFVAGMYGPLYNYRESIPMGSLSTVFSAEVMAILRCTELLTKNLTRRIHICSDSRAVLAALAKTTTESSLVWECMQVLENISKFNSHFNVDTMASSNTGQRGSRQAG
jgi:hypothetical protein